MSVSRSYARFGATLKLTDVPQKAIDIIRFGIADCIGVMIAGGSRAPVDKLVEMGDLQTGRCRCFLGSERRSADVAALISGTAAHVLDFDDTAWDCHPSAVLVPTLLAIGDEVAVSGRDALVAYVAGYEVWADLRNRVKGVASPYSAGWHPSGVYGAIAAAASASVLYALDEERTAQALSIAASFASGLVANFGSPMKPLHVGRAAQSGIQAAKFAKAGITANGKVFEHPSGFLRAISAGSEIDGRSERTIGSAFWSERYGLNIKFYPICFGAHRVAEASIDLAHRFRINTDEIARIDVTLGDEQSKALLYHRPETIPQARFSAEFAVAAGLITGACTLESLTEDFLRQARVRALMERTHLTLTAERDADEPLLAPFDSVSVILKSGAQLTSDRIERPLGYHTRSVSESEVWEKFMQCTEGDWAPARQRSTFDAVMNIDELDALSALAAWDT